MKKFLLQLAFILSFGALNTARADAVSSLLALPYTVRQEEISRLIDNYKHASDTLLIAEVNSELRKSLSNDYPQENRISITELASKLGDQTSLPIIVPHLDIENPGTHSVGLGFGSFVAVHPYAAAVAHFHSNSLPAVLDAVASSSNSDFDRVAETAVIFMSKDIVFQLLDRYQSTPEGTKLSTFITACLAVIAPGHEGVKYVQDRITITNGANELGRLRKLEADLQDPKLKVAISWRGSLAPAWP